MRVLLLLGFIPVAWVGGNIVFGLLAGGSWLPLALWFLPDPAFDVVLTTFLWLCRGGAFLALVFVYIIEPAHAADPSARAVPASRTDRNPAAPSG